MDSIRAVYMQEHATGGPTPLRGSAPSSERLLFAQSIRLIHFMSPPGAKGGTSWSSRNERRSWRSYGRILRKKRKS